ncbi:MAG: hypothetical protein KAJ07_04115 [Planctomycetes bacterium]|nr:hypothetical protein [Planctomycetota bacterium]
MPIEIEHILDDEGGVVFRIDLSDAMKAFSRISIKKIPFNVDYIDSSILICPPKDPDGHQPNVHEIRAALKQ